MTTYEIPAEPDVDTLWVTVRVTGEIIRWTRKAEPDAEVVWQSEGEDIAWPGLLSMGQVTDFHPGLPSCANLPWRISVHNSLDIVDNFGNRVFKVYGQGSSSSQDKERAELVVRAVNAYADSFSGPTVELEWLRRVEVAARKVIGIRQPNAPGYWPDLTELRNALGWQWA